MKKPSTTTNGDINRVGFLKYTDVCLRDKEDILILYRDIYAKGAHYNVHITKFEDITDTTNTTIPVTATLSSVTVIALTGNRIYQKLGKSGTINKKYKTA